MGEALRDCWIEEDVQDIFCRNFYQLREIFEEHSNRIDSMAKEQKIVVEDILSASMRSASLRESERLAKTTRFTRSERHSKEISPKTKSREKKTLISKLRRFKE